MKLTSLNINGFRSIETATIEAISELNVFVGRNNSGKSNILSATRAFFSCISSAEVCTIDAIFGKPLDFHRGTDDSPNIAVKIGFELTDLELQSIKNSLLKEAPQLKAACDSIAAPAQLLVETVYVDTYAYVSSIALHHRAGSHPILAVSPISALELSRTLTEVAQLRREASGLRELARRLDEGEWEYLQKESPGFLQRRLIHHADVSPFAAREILDESKTYKDFIESLEKRAIQADDRSEEAKNQPLSHPVSTFSGESNVIPEYVSAILTQLASIKLVYLGDRRRPIGPAEAEQLLQLKVTRGGPERLAAVQRTVSALLGVTIDAFQSTEGVRRRREGSAELDVDDFLIDVNGSGIKEALRIILDIEFRSPDILFVEEPEVHLHPALETTMMQFLRTISGSTQTFITTHSTNFLDAPELTNIYFVHKDRSTTVTRLNPEEVGDVIPSDLGIRLSSLFMFDRLIFVEGPSDELVLREFAVKNSIDLAQANCGFVHMGGRGNLRVLAQNGVMEMLTRRGVVAWFLIDRDEAPKEFLDRMQGDIDKSVHLINWKRRELENYLLDPEAISELLRTTRPEQCGDLTVARVAAAMSEVMDDSMRKKVIALTVAARRCKPVYPDRIPLGEELPQAEDGAALRFRIEKAIEILRDQADGLEADLTSTESAIAARWDTEKHHVTPGSWILERLFSRFGASFKKSRDSVRLARLMSLSKVDGEIYDHLKKLAVVE